MISASPASPPSSPSISHSTYIAPEGASFSQAGRELWHYRELLYFLAWRELKTRYMQTALGAAWVILQPLAMMVIFTIFFGKFARVPSDGVPPPVFYYAGLLLWTFFANTLSSTSNSLTGNAHLITKVYFPRLCLPLAAVVSRLADFLVAFLVLVPLMIFYRTPLTWHILAAPLVVTLTALLAFGLGLLLAAWNVRFRDVGHLLPLIIQLWMFASPIIYSTQLVPEKWRGLFMFNPLVGIMNNFRAALFGLPFDFAALSISVAAAVLVAAKSLQVFRRMEDTFADVI